MGPVETNLLLVVGGAAVIAFLIAAILFAVKGPKRRQMLEDDQVQKGKTKLAAIGEAAQGLNIPTISLPSNTETGKVTSRQPAGFTSIEEFPIGAKLGYRITRIVHGTKSRVTVKIGSINVRPGYTGKISNLLFFTWSQKQNVKWVNAAKILKVTTQTRKGTVDSYELVYDILAAEPLNANGSITWDDSLEGVLADSGLDQYVEIAAYEGKFEFTPTLQKVLIFLGLLMFVGGLAINGSAHVVPTTIIHWRP